MLALRDQENLVNTHQTVAANKPLNQGVKQLGPKTPGRKVRLNDENNTIAFGKQTVKGNGNRLENSKPGKDAFVTPMDTKNRAPLGNKTTNLKAKGLQTPAPFGGTLKPERTNRRASTQKVKKAAPVTQQPQTKVHLDVPQDDVADIEYMPPRARDLPDFPDDLAYDTTYPQFRPRNRALGLESVYGRQEVGRDGLTKKQRKFQEDSAKCDKMVDEMIMKQLDAVSFNERSDDEAVQPVARVPLASTSRSRAPSTNVRPSRNIPTLRSREAAAALSAPKTRSASARVAAAPKPSGVSSLLMPKKKVRVPTNPSSMRNTAAAMNSNTTVGYSKGRSVSSTLRENELSTNAPLSPETYMQLYGPPPLGSEMWTRCKAAGCFDTEENAGQELQESLPTFAEDEEADSFQLTL
ncbi:uncharacterized protein N7484_001952 [Penicillium longicatenatum]|uniref:uncharacterized protein n=1 Tax=Penicillium longicatenatum TaxID=1561947 RepID=UPI0025473B15|nr:uncharacterized protein N7484_001952 [Penicillium longicatenatum]KAJ5658303.1 hypothetical protein N7484_001952 [Penicillium longicatenatum]